MFSISIHLNIWFQSCFLIKLNYSMYFFSIYPPFYACFRALMCTTYYLLSYIVHKSFLHLLISVLSAKNGRLLSSVFFFFGYSTSTSRIYQGYPRIPSRISTSYFFMKSSSNLDKFFIHLKQFTGNF